MPFDPTRSHQIPPDPARSRQIPSDPTRSRQIPPDPARSRQIPPDPTRSRQIPPDPARPHQVPPEVRVPPDPTRSESTDELWRTDAGPDFEQWVDGWGFFRTSLNRHGTADQPAPAARAMSADSMGDGSGFGAMLDRVSEAGEWEGLSSPCASSPNGAEPPPLPSTAGPGGRVAADSEAVRDEAFREGVKSHLGNTRIGHAPQR